MSSSHRPQVAAAPSAHSDARSAPTSAAATGAWHGAIVARLRTTRLGIPAAARLLLRVVGRGPRPEVASAHPSGDPDRNPPGGLDAALPDGLDRARVTALVYELLDAHLDTMDLAGRIDDEVAWSVHLLYLRVLQRECREMLAQIGLEEAA